jgi:hypothetical protein
VFHGKASFRPSERFITCEHTGRQPIRRGFDIELRVAPLDLAHNAMSQVADLRMAGRASFRALGPVRRIKPPIYAGPKCPLSMHQIELRLERP